MHFLLLQNNSYCMLYTVQWVHSIGTCTSYCRGYGTAVYITAVYIILQGIWYCWVHHTAGDMVQLCTLQLGTSYCRAYGTAVYIILQGIWYSVYIILQGIWYSCVHHTAGHMVQLCTAYCRAYGTAVYM